MKRLALIVLAVAACHSDSVVGITAGYLTPGVWGGTNSEIDASSTSTSISIGCQSGTFPGNVPVDNQGKFSVNGSWNLSVGPVFLNGNMPAQATGQVSGSSVTFAVAVYDTTNKRVTSLGPATAKLGQKPGIQICPV